MPYDPDRHHRRSMRLKGYDYATPGAYFVTIVTQQRVCVYGEVVMGEMELNEAGRMIEKWWLELNHKFPTVDTDVYMVMPNHFHGIVVIVPPNRAVNVGADLRVGPSTDEHGHRGEHRGEHVGSPLPTVIQWFKTMTTNEYIRGVKQSGWPPFPGKLWQRNYYEYIVRHDDDLRRIRTYIAQNPLQWVLDDENPEKHR